MALVRWDPLREFSSLPERMERLFSDMRTRPAWAEEEMTQGSWIPPVDIYETADAIVLKAELPGITKEDINLEVKDNTLMLRGEKKFEKNVKEESDYRVERFYGMFQRAFLLPSTVQPEKVKAKFRNGVLEIYLPKAEGAKPKQIKVDVA